MKAETITRLANLRELSRDDAAKALPVHVRAVVTWKGLRGQLVVQDDTGGCWILLDEARKQRPKDWDETMLGSIHIGHVLEIDGVSNPGSYAPGIVPKTLRTVGEQPLPKAQPTNRERFFGGAEAGLRVEVRGVVQDFESAELGWELKLDANPGRFTVEFPRSALPDPSALIDAEVRVTGVASTRVNTRGELTMPRVFSSQASELVIEAPAPPPFAAPLVQLDRLLPFRPQPVGPHRLRVTGIVTYALAEKVLYLQQGTSAVRVETRSPEQFQDGDRVEAAGFVDMTRHVGMLVQAQVRKVGNDTAPAAVPINPEEVIALNKTAIKDSKMAQPHDFDGHLIRFTASLLAVQTAPEPNQPWRRLILKRGEMILGAVLAAGETSALDGLRIGSELEVTGIVQLEYTSVAVPRVSLVPTRLDVLLRRASDVKVLNSPSWWSARRLLGAIVIVAAAFCSALLWAWQLRRQVRLRTKQLAVEIRARRDASVEFQATLRERNRLAVNLHDTLLQTLGGIGFQIGASEAEAALPDRAGKPIAQLTVARRILDHAVQELRSSVWALRSPPLEGKSLPEALRLIAEREGAGKLARIQVRTEGDFTQVSDFVAGNLLFAAQEALRNALKHGSPNQITVEARTTERADWISLIIRDDGKGFVAGQTRGAPQGHFGLVGMRERVERLDGTLQIDSAPGQGTTVRLEAPLRSYDKTVA
jgi:signal transduction histidine kinase